MVIMVKSLPVKSGDIRETGAIPRLERSPGGGHGKENLMARGAWRATVHGVAKSQT